MRLKILAVAVAALAAAAPASVAGATTPTGPPQSATAKAGEPAGPFDSGQRPGAGRNVNVTYPVGCYTTFLPSAPGGGPMLHYYANCSSSYVVVCPAVDVGATRTVFTSSWRSVGPYNGSVNESDAVWWFYPSTISNGNYTTVFC